jgi:5-methylcytosine-specific restriction endonuclease McrA
MAPKRTPKAGSTPQIHLRLSAYLATALTSLATLRQQSRNEVIVSLLTKALRESYKEYLTSDAWKAKRKAVLIRDGLRCQLCGHDKNLHVHHITYERIYVEDLEDLITVCQRCHENVHSKKS